MTTTQNGCSYSMNATIKITNEYMISDKARRILGQILQDAGLTKAKVTSGTRSSADQARIMYGNVQTHGVAHQKNLYGSTGDKVIDVYDANQSLPRDQVIGLMQEKIDSMGCGKVSNHCGSTREAFDVAPSSIVNKPAFIQAVNAHKEVLKFLKPPADPAYHIEISK